MTGIIYIVVTYFEFHQLPHDQGRQRCRVNSPGVFFSWDHTRGDLLFQFFIEFNSKYFLVTLQVGAAGFIMFLCYKKSKKTGNHDKKEVALPDEI